MTTTGGNVGGIDTGTDAYITEDAYTVEDYGDTAVATVTKEDDKGMMSADAYMVGEPDTATNIEDTDVEGGGGFDNKLGCQPRRRRKSQNYAG